MQIKIVSEHLNGLVVLHPEVFEDGRGFFMEVFRADQFRELGLPDSIAQENHSLSRGGVVRGLHFQWQPPMGKIMRVTAGSAYLVAVDIRKGSPTLGKHFGIEVTMANKLMVWAPAGFARGFCVLSDSAEIQYLCTGVYNSRCEAGILWNDPALGIDWPVRDPVVSEKDRKARTLAQWLQTPEADHFRFET